SRPAERGRRTAAACRYQCSARAGSACPFRLHVRCSGEVAERRRANAFSFRCRQNLREGPVTTRSAVSDAFWKHLGVKPNTSTSVDSDVSRATVALLYKQLPHGLLASVVNSALLVW